MIPLTDLRIQYQSIRKEIDSAIGRILERADFILGEELELLEKEISQYIGVKYAVGVGSGTDALVLALSGLGIGRGDEVITTPFTFIATAEAIVRTGAKPVFCDIDPRTYNIDPQKIEEKITKRTKAIIPVHLYGLPCNMDKILEIAKSNDLKVVEDCAQSFGSEYKGKKVGSFGDCGCFSFFPAKTLGCFGDGGMITTNDEEFARRIKMLRNHGSTTKYYYSLHGFNSRLDTLQAAILRVKLKYIDGWINKRIENASLYNKLLSQISSVEVPFVPGSEYKHTFNYYTVRIKGKRDYLRGHLREKGVSCAVYYPLCLHLQEVYRGLNYERGVFPYAESAQEEVLSLPIYPELSRSNIEKISNFIKEALASKIT